MRPRIKKSKQAECRRLLERAAKLVSGKTPGCDEALECIDAARYLLLQLGGKPAHIIFLPKWIGRR
jgi:hypothetical protein